MENTNKPKLSVIIPVYKAEKFIERCCVSLFEQTLDNIEYIFVDDCSPDNSVNKIREIVARYPEREPMVKILSHSPNRGVSFSRQQGLEAATGEFVIHCDSDDWVDQDMYESAYKAAIDNDADVVRMGYITEYSVRVGKRRTRVYYHLEPKGAEFLQQVKEQYFRTTSGVQNIMETLKVEAEEIAKAKQEKENDNTE